MFRWVPAVLVGCLLIPATGKLYASDDYSQIHSYIGGGLHHWSSQNSSANGVKVHFGQQLNSFVSAEAHAGTGGKDSATDVSLDRLFGLYGKFALPLELISPYVKLGVTSASVKQEGESTTEFEFSYGVGTAINFTPRLYVDLEYMVYLDSDELELDGFTLGIGYKLP